MRSYELTCEILTSVSEEELKAIIEKISHFISESQGKVEKTTDPLKRRLAYPINGNREVFLVDFTLQSDNLAALEKKLKSENNVIRHIIVKKVKQEYLRDKKPARKEPIVTDEQVQTDISKEEIKETDEQKPKKVELKEIDQKIEEILSD